MNTRMVAGDWTVEVIARIDHNERRAEYVVTHKGYLVGGEDPRCKARGRFADLDDVKRVMGADFAKLKVET